MTDSVIELTYTDKKVESVKKPKVESYKNGDLHSAEFIEALTGFTRFLIFKYVGALAEHSEDEMVSYLLCRVYERLTDRPYDPVAYPNTTFTTYLYGIIRNGISNYLYKQPKTSDISLDQSEQELKAKHNEEDLLPFNLDSRLAGFFNLSIEKIEKDLKSCFRGGTFDKVYFKGMSQMSRSLAKVVLWDFYRQTQ